MNTIFFIKMVKLGYNKTLQITKVKDLKIKYLYFILIKVKKKN